MFPPPHQRQFAPSTPSSISFSDSPEIPPHLANQPVRQYPLRQLNEPAVFVLGDKVGQKVPAAGGMPMVSGGGGGAFPGRGDPQAMLAQQNRDMEALERRAQRDRSASMNQVRTFTRFGGVRLIDGCWRGV